MSSEMPGHRRTITTNVEDVESTYGIRVLHVDDDELEVDLVRDSLERHSDRFSVKTVTDPTEVLHKFDAPPTEIDCVVSDYQMPRLDGIDLLSEVRANHPDLPFILFTGKGSEEVASDAISAGVTDYLQKDKGIEIYEILANRIENAVSWYRAEQRVRRSLQAMERAREGISLIGEDQRFTFLNEAYAEMVGYDREELLGEHWEVLYPPGGASEIREVLSEISGSDLWEGETTYVRGDGDHIVVDHALSFTDDGTMICLIRDLHDETTGQH